MGEVFGEWDRGGGRKGLRIAGERIFFKGEDDCEFEFGEVFG